MATVAAAGSEMYAGRPIRLSPSRTSLRFALVSGSGGRPNTHARESPRPAEDDACRACRNRDWHRWGRRCLPEVIRGRTPHRPLLESIDRSPTRSGSRKREADLPGIPDSTSGRGASRDAPPRGMVAHDRTRGELRVGRGKATRFDPSHSIARSAPWESPSIVERRPAWTSPWLYLTAVANAVSGRPSAGDTTLLEFQPPISPL